MTSLPARDRLRRSPSCAAAIAAVTLLTSVAGAQTVLYSGGEWDFENGFHAETHVLAGQCSNPPPGKQQSCVPNTPGTEDVGNGWTHWAAFPDWPEAFGHFGYAQFNMNQFMPNVTRGVRSQEITMTCANGVGVIYRQAQLPQNRRIRFEADARYTYTYEPGWPPGEVSMGLDPTGGTNPVAASVQWFPWDSPAPNVFNHTVEEIVSTGPAITVFIRFIHRQPHCQGDGTFLVDNVIVTDMGPAGPLMAVAPNVLTPSAVVGTNAGAQTFTIRNTGTGVLDYAIVDDAPWLSVNPTSGDSAGETDTVNVVCDTAALPVGEHAAQITIDSPNGLNAPQTIAVILTIRRKPGDADGDGDVDQEDFGHFQRCFSGPGIPQNDPACFMMRLDEDTDVDQDDFTIFQRCMSGANTPSDPLCAGQSG